MKQITAIGQNPPVKAIYRFKGKFVYLKCGNWLQSGKIIANIKAKGGIIKYGLKTPWMQIDLFGDNKNIKMGGQEINLDSTSEEEIETILINFFLKQLELLKYETKLEDI